MSGLLNILTKHLHWVIILYALFSYYEYIVEQQEIVGNLEGRIAPIDSKISRSQRELNDIKKFQKDLDNSRAKVRNVIRQIKKVQKQLPTEVNDTEVQQLVGNVAKDIKIKNPSPLPGNETLKEYYFAKEYVFTGSGTFLQFLIFYENLGKQDRILNVKTLEMVMEDGKQRGRFPILNIETKIESYRYNIKHIEKAKGLK